MKAPVYLANAAVVAASAVKGWIASPLALAEEASHV
jgi:homoaconitase/3-isopropylmalate dehydratase large subunit